MAAVAQPHNHPAKSQRRGLVTDLPQNNRRDGTEFVDLLETVALVAYLRLGSSTLRRQEGHQKEDNPDCRRYLAGCGPAIAAAGDIVVVRFVPGVLVSWAGVGPAVVGRRSVCRRTSIGRYRTVSDLD